MKLLQAHILLCSLLIGGYVAAEVRTITATGEYRMGDNDIRTDAKRLALLDAKRLALEQAGTYLESVTEVKNLQVAKDELRAYTAGIVEVTEQTTRDVMEGATHIVRVEVIAKIDTGMVARQIDALRKNETAKVEITRLMVETGRLRQELEKRTQELAGIKSRTEAEFVAQKRRQEMTKADANELLAKAWASLTRSGDRILLMGSSKADARNHAKVLIQKALALDFDAADSHNLMGLILHEEGDYAAAVDEYRIVLRLQPHTPEAHNNLGNALQVMGEIERAVSEFREAIRLRPSWATAHINLCYAFYRKGSFREAISECQHAIRLDPENALAHLNLEIALQASGKLPDAMEEYRLALRLNPDITLAHNNLCVGLLLAGNVTGAIDECRAELRLNPDLAMAHNNLGNALWSSGDLDGAMEQYLETLRLDPLYAQAHNNIGLILYAQGNLDGAVKEYREAIRLAPQIPEPHYGLGHALKTQGIRRESAREFREFLRLAQGISVDQEWIQRARSELRELER